MTLTAPPRCHCGAVAVHGLALAALSVNGLQTYTEVVQPACFRHVLAAVRYSELIGRGCETFDLSTGHNTSAEVIGPHYRAVR